MSSENGKHTQPRQQQEHRQRLQLSKKANMYTTK